MFSGDGVRDLVSSEVVLYKGSLLLLRLGVGLGNGEPTCLCVVRGGRTCR